MWGRRRVRGYYTDRNYLTQKVTVGISGFEFDENECNTVIGIT